MKHSIWVEKYRPKNLDEVIFQDDRQRDRFLAFVANGDIPHLFLSGVQGTGKSTISMVLTSALKVDRADVLKINCSDEKIDAIRSKVTNFAMSMPLGAFKVVRLEEIDYLSLDAQALLRSLIEDSSSTCRFIATCNYANKVIAPLKSRFQAFSFKAPNKDQIALRIADILDREGIKYSPEDVITYVDVSYPDVRAAIQLVQSNSVGGTLLSPQSTSVQQSDWKFGLLTLLGDGDFKAARKLVCESATREEHDDVFRFLYENLYKMKMEDKDSAILTIADYHYKHHVVSDTELNIAALFTALGKIK